MYVYLCELLLILVYIIFYCQSYIFHLILLNIYYVSDFLPTLIFLIIMICVHIYYIVCLSLFSFFIYCACASYNACSGRTQRLRAFGASVRSWTERSAHVAKQWTQIAKRSSHKTTKNKHKNKHQNKYLILYLYAYLFKFLYLYLCLYEYLYFCQRQTIVSLFLFLFRFVSANKEKEIICR